MWSVVDDAVNRPAATRLLRRRFSGCAEKLERYVAPLDDADGRKATLVLRWCNRSRRAKSQTESVSNS